MNKALKIFNNTVLESSSGKKLSLDLRFFESDEKKPLIIFVHGFKGFRNWGCFDLMANKIAENGLIVLKMNFSHNGTTVENPSEFDALEAFAKNTLSKELADIETVLAFIKSDNFPAKNDFNSSINIIGHSRGGVSALIAANKTKAFDKIITWASPSYFQERFKPEEIAYWKENGRIYIDNARTGQKMPMDYDIAEDFLKNKEDYEPINNAQKLEIPYLVVHGTNDKTVDVNCAYKLMKNSQKASLFVINNGEHTFGATHPYVAENLPKDFQIILDTSISFIKN